MRAWHVEAPGPVTGHPLRLHTDDEVPRPGPGELLLRVLACGVCRTDLHVTEGDLPPHRPGVPAAYAHRLPPGYTNEELAPLLCAGIIGYRALQRAELPDHGRLGIYGFGGSAHLAVQVALARGATVHVLTRGEQAKRLALELGAASVGDADGMPPEPLDAAILFAPVGDLVLPAMAALDRGGTLSIAGIHLTDIPPLNYEKHLFQERQLRSVTSNTRDDAREFLAFAAGHKLAVTVHPYPLDAANQALRDLKAGRFDGAAVLIP